MAKNAFDPLQMEIKNFIFHVVQHGEDQPILMDDTPIAGFESFFKKRIIEILNGNRFEFVKDSDFLNSLRAIDENEERFVEVSKTMATKFHSHQDNRIKAGVMILMKVLWQGSMKYILIKYDHEEVITYIHQGKKAMLQEIKNTFTKSKEALQKSVVVELNGSTTAAYVVDKSEPANITKFFKGFLGVTRKYNDQDLTERVKEAYLNTVKKHRANLPPNYTSNASFLFYETVQAHDIFLEEEFLQKAFNIYYTPEIKKVFQKELKSLDILGESFQFNKKIRKPKQRKLRTEEGVLIQFPTDAEDTIVIQNLPNKTVVTITTHKLHEESQRN